MFIIDGKMEGDTVLDKAYLEETYLIDTKEYNYLVEECTNKKTFKLRKIYFNKDINYLGGMRHQNRNFDRYSINIRDFSEQRYEIERQSYRDGTFFSSYTYLNDNDCRRIIQGDWAWMEKYQDSLIRQMYIQLQMNHMEVGVVVDYEREVYRVRYKNAYVIFDRSIASTYDFEDRDIFDPDLPMCQRLQKKHCVMTFHEDIMIPGVLTHLMNCSEQKKLAVDL